MYLVQTYPEDWNETNGEAHYPQGYPGERKDMVVFRGAFSMDVWDSAGRTLDERGLIDPTRVGIEGFSREGRYVEFILAHAKTHYRAATATRRGSTCRMRRKPRYGSIAAFMELAEQVRSS
jgi:hypothetical protein